jgi:methylenetetrahydrofolate reductase (NADPH)
MAESITDILKTGSESFSIEVFPPKPIFEKTLEVIFTSIERLKVLCPAFVSVTYGSGGYNRERALAIAKHITENGFCALSHLTAVGYQRTDVTEILDQFYYLGIRNILALRGDIPPDLTFPDFRSDQFHYAFDLIEHIKKDGRFCIGAAAYPEGYADSKEVGVSVRYLKKKAEAGADFFITQLFYDNDCYFRFIDKVRAQGITQPIIPAIMPILRNTNTDRILKLSATTLPLSLQEKLQRFADDKEEKEKVGMAHAVGQIMGLRGYGVDHIHLYTMNKSRQIIDICRMSTPGIFLE